ENWDQRTKTLLLERMETRFHREGLDHFSNEEAVLLDAVLSMLIPQKEDERIDLVGFLDWALDKPLGRGDRKAGMPPEDILFHRGLEGIRQTSQEMFGRRFEELEPEKQKTVLEMIQRGIAKGEAWDSIPSPVFFTKLLSKALIGYCAHPFAWMRMGFPGPSYPEGYVWITQSEIKARRNHFPGWKTF
ncbi:MAG: gluconate 2-dehydrogenase subunit 3 family protein, partial [Candidatus Latescibacterota bacterium]